MQSKEIILTNTKTFPEIWSTLTSSEQDDLCIKFYQRKCCKSRQAIYLWSKGQRKPTNPMVRDAIAAIVSKVVGAKCFPDTLFPVY